MKFSYVNPTVIHFGQGQIAQISSSIPTSSKVLVVYSASTSLTDQASISLAG
ncbi:hypothetical protein AAFX24_08645 [Vibrio mediterranei]